MFAKDRTAKSSWYFEKYLRIGCLVNAFPQVVSAIYFVWEVTPKPQVPPETPSGPSTLTHSRNSFRPHYGYLTTRIPRRQEDGEFKLSNFAWRSGSRPLLRGAFRDRTVPAVAVLVEYYHYSSSAIPSSLGRWNSFITRVMSQFQITYMSRTVWTMDT